jgi:hypothetical protein
MQTKFIDSPFEEAHAYDEDDRCVHELLQSIDLGLHLVVERLEALLGDEETKTKILQEIKEFRGENV